MKLYQVADGGQEMEAVKLSLVQDAAQTATTPPLPPAGSELAKRQLPLAPLGRGKL